MNTSIILIAIELGHETRIFNQLKKISEVKRIYETYGAYDIIIEVSANDNDKLLEVIRSEVRKIEHVRSTITLVVQNIWEKD